MKKLLAPILATAVALLTAQPAWAYIDPYFTPVIMTRQSDIILHLQVESVKDMQATFTVVEALKGKTDQKTISLDLSKVAVKEQREFLEKKLKDIGKMPVLMFYGSFQRDQGSEKEAVAFLHVEDGWAACFTKDGKWIFDGMDQKMAGTYQGSTDMLLRAVKYILGDEGADMPVREDIAWDGEPVKFAGNLLTVIVPTAIGSLNTTLPPRRSSSTSPPATACRPRANSSPLATSTATARLT